MTMKKTLIVAAAAMLLAACGGGAKGGTTGTTSTTDWRLEAYTTPQAACAAAGADTVVVLANTARSFWATPAVGCLLEGAALPGGAEQPRRLHGRQRREVEVRTAMRKTLCVIAAAVALTACGQGFSSESESDNPTTVGVH